MTNPQVPEGARLTTPQAESSYQNGTGRSFSSDGVEALSRAAAEKAVAVTRAEAVKAAEGLVAFAENVADDTDESRDCILLASGGGVRGFYIN